MAQRRFHYDLAFEHYLRANTIPYIAVDEAKKALHGPRKLKSFDFVVYGRSGPNLLADVKGRKHSGRTRKHFDNWVTEADVTDMLQWQQLFGQGFTAAFVFMFWCETQPPDALFTEIFEYRDRWYAVLAITTAEYQKWMRPRSAKWKTVNIPADAFGQFARPLREILDPAANQRGGGASK